MKHVSEIIQAYLDGELSSDRRIALEEHCAACPACAEELREASALWSVVDQARAPELSRSLWPSIQHQRKASDGRSENKAAPWRRLGTTMATTGLATGALAAGLALGLLVGSGDDTRTGVTLDTALVTDSGPVIELPTTLADESATLLAGAGMTLADLWVAAIADEENGT